MAPDVRGAADFSASFAPLPVPDVLESLRVRAGPVDRAGWPVPFRPGFYGIGCPGRPDGAGLGGRLRPGHRAPAAAFSVGQPRAQRGGAGSGGPGRPAAGPGLPDPVAAESPSAEGLGSGLDDHRATLDPAPLGS